MQLEGWKYSIHIGTNRCLYSGNEGLEQLLRGTMAEVGTVLLEANSPTSVFELLIKFFVMSLCFFSCILQLLFCGPHF